MDQLDVTQSLKPGAFDDCLAEFDRLMNQDEPAPARLLWALLKELVAYDVAHAGQTRHPPNGV